jgi:hypothetical protein
MALLTRLNRRSIRSLTNRYDFRLLTLDQKPLLTLWACQWEIHDYVIYAAGQYGLRVILPLTDNYDFYYGSKMTFLRWNTVSASNFGNAFYTNNAVIASYKVIATLSLGSPSRKGPSLMLSDRSLTSSRCSLGSIPTLVSSTARIRRSCLGRLVRPRSGAFSTLRR